MASVVKICPKFHCDYCLFDICLSNGEDEESKYGELFPSKDHWKSYTNANAHFVVCNAALCRRMGSKTSLERVKFSNKLFRRCYNHCIMQLLTDNGDTHQPAPTVPTVSTATNNCITNSIICSFQQDVNNTVSVRSISTDTITNITSSNSDKEKLDGLRTLHVCTLHTSMVCEMTKFFPYQKNSHTSHTDCQYRV